MKTILILQRRLFFSICNLTTNFNQLSNRSISLVRKSSFLVCIGLLGFNSWGQIAQTVILDPGITSWQSPVGVTEITVKCWGGGGGGGRSTTSGQGGSGGGSGGYTTRTIALNGQTTFNVVVGNRGTRQAQNSSAAATAGGNTSFINTGLSINLIANGGGFGSQNSGAAGSGGSASGGSTNTAGNSGAVGGSSGGAGGNAPNGGLGGAARQNGDGNAGATPGGGGGGGERDNNDRRGGHGGNGRIEISYTLPESSFTSFRSIAAASWSATSTWQMSADGTNWVTATFVPNSSTLNISILNDVTITDLTIPTTQTVTIGDAQLTVSGNLINNGIIASSDGNSTLEVQGNFSNSGTIGVANDLILRGNFTNTNSSLSLSCKVLIQGTSNQNIGSFSCSDNVEMEKTGGTATFIGNVTCSGDLILNGNGGTLDLGASLTHIFSGKIEFERGTLNGGSATLNANGDQQDAWTRNNSHTTSFVAGSGTVVFGRSGDQTINTTTAGLTTFNNVTFAGSGVKTIPAVITVNGNLTLTGTASTALAANETIGGNVTIGAGTTLARSTFSLTTLGNFVNNGTLSGSGAVNFTGGAATQTISGTGALNFSNVTVSKTAGVVRLENNITISGALNFEVFNFGIMNLNGKTLTYSGTNIQRNGGGLIGSTISSKLIISKSNQIPSGLFQSEIYDLEISGLNTIVSSADNYTILNNLTVGNGATFTKEDGYTIIFKGDVVNNGSIIDGTSGIFGGSIVFNNTVNQTISGQPVSIANLEVVKASGKLIVSTEITVTGKLEMNGNIDNPSSLITLGNSSEPGSLVYTSGTITGALRRYFPSTPGSSTYFPVGNTSNTRGATIAFTSSPGANQYLTVKYQGGAAGGTAPLYTGLPLTTGDGVLIQNFDEEGYWEINPTANDYAQSINTTPYTITLQMKNLSNVNDRSTVRIIKAAGSNNSSQHHSAWTALTFDANAVSGNSNSDFTVTGTSTGFSWFGAGSGNNNPLPVELVSFSGLCEEGVVNLTWQTASEFNSSHFDVEKSRDGENWQLLSTVPSAGTSNELITYQSFDKNGTNGNNYYRLRQVDIDGTEKVYDPINVSCTEETAGYFSSFPNPSGTSFQVVVNNKELIGTCTLNMVDATGKVMEQREIEVNEGINMFVINQELTPGIYFLNITNGSKSTSMLRHAIK